jgi:hypothetical protein
MLGGKNGVTVTIPERITNFLREREGTPYCDDCIAKQLGLERRQQAQQATSALGQTGKFLRSKGLCFDCNKDKLVIRIST